MANIMINDVCNLKCPYCFANEYVNGDTSTDITYANFKKAVDWINASGDKTGIANRIGFIGGEPLLHHQFEDLIRYVSMQRRPHQEVLVFTNGILADRYVSLFAKHEIALLLNVNSPKDIGERNYEKLRENIRLLRQKNVVVSIGVNLYRRDMDFQFIYDLIEEFAFKTLRVGLVSPNTQAKKERGSFAYFKEIRKPFLNLTEECAKRDCSVHLDCQKMPYCIFRDDLEHIEQLRETYKLPIEITDCATCTPVLDILTNLKVVRCFGLSGGGQEVNMESFATEDDLAGYFRTNIDNIGMMVPMQKDCIDCYERNIGKCQGGCLSYKIDKINQIVKPTALRKV